MLTEFSKFLFFQTLSAPSGLMGLLFEMRLANDAELLIIACCIIFELIIEFTDEQVEFEVFILSSTKPPPLPFPLPLSSPPRVRTITSL